MQKEFNKLPNISNMLLSVFLIFNIIYLPLSLPISKFRYVETNRQTQEGKQQVVGTHLLTHIEHPYVPYVCCCQRSWIIRTELKDNFLISLCIFSVAVLSSPSHILSLAFIRLVFLSGSSRGFCPFLVIQNGRFLPEIILILFHHDPGCLEAMPYFVVARILDLPN